MCVLKPEVCNLMSEQSKANANVSGICNSAQALNDHDIQFSAMICNLCITLMRRIMLGVYI